MKIKNISLLAAAMLILGACSDDTTDPVLELRQAATLNALTTSDITITNTNATAQFPEITWERADYGKGAVVNYVVTLTSNATGRSVVIGETGECGLTFTNGEMNAILARLGAQPGVAADYTVALLAQAFDAYQDAATNTIGFRATAYDPAVAGIDWPFAYVAVGYPDWDFASSYVIGDPDGDGTYQGYVQFDGAVNYAILDGADVTSVLAAGLQSPEAGFIEVTLAGGAVSHSVATTWGLIGDATSGGWSDDTAMEYDPDTRLWTAVTSLTANSFKFRANKDWGINYGTDGVSDNGLAPGGNDILVPEESPYIVSLNLTNAGKYTYTMEKTSIELSSSYMTLPGSYQGWNPDADDCYRVVSDARDFKYTGAYYFAAGTEFKFYDGGTWIGIVGDMEWNDATNSSTFVMGDGGNIVVPVSAYLKITADTKKMVATMAKTGWEVIGDATAGAWDYGQLMDYDPATGLWSITITLTSGDIKFRWDASWTINLGGELNALTQDGANIHVNAGTYFITLDPNNNTASITAI